jgi:glycosyltransferase involved in cell wall biosynthesis
MKITIVTPRFGISGVPLAQVRFALVLSKRGHDVTLFIGHLELGCNLPVAPGVRIVYLEKLKVRGMLLPLIWHLRKDHPEVVSSAEDHLNIMVLLAVIISRSSAKTSGSSRVLPTDRHGYSNWIFSKGWLLKNVMKRVMWRANALTCVSRDMVGHYRKIFSNAPHVRVYNLVKDEASMVRAQEPVDHPWLVDKECPVIISAGTMTKRKGFADLITAFSISQKIELMRLIILGEDYLMDDFAKLVKRLDIGDRVSLPGNVSNPLKYFSRSDVFVLSSYAEGMPNVLVEAMMCGCTPVATNCPTGPREPLYDGRIGHLVEMKNPLMMADVIVKAVRHPLAKEVLSKAVAPFEECTVLDRHFEVLGFTVSS